MHDLRRHVANLRIPADSQHVNSSKVSAWNARFVAIGVRLDSIASADKRVSWAEALGCIGNCSSLEMRGRIVALRMPCASSATLNHLIPRVKLARQDGLRDPKCFYFNTFIVRM
jgi:hypothetical protein